MKVIDLLNKIANGEEVPKEIKYNNINYYWCNQCKIYERIEDGRKDLYNDLDNLNDEVEILEEEPRVQVELTEEEYLEHLDKINEYMKRVRAYIPKPSFLKLEEEKKIPEKLKIEDDGNTITLYGEKENEWTILDNVDVIICNKINSIIDYLKSKGE